MTTYYMSTVDGSDASDGLSWDNAFATLKYAIETASAAASGPHTLLVDSASVDNIAADTSIAAAGDINVLCVNRSTGALAVMDRTNSYIGNSSASYSISILGGYSVYFYGLAFRIAGTGNKTLTAVGSDGASYTYENCSLDTGSNYSTSAGLILGGSASSTQSAVRFINCTFYTNNASNRISVRTASVDIIGGAVANITLTGNLFATSNSTGHGNITVHGCDLSLCSGYLLGDTTGSNPVRAVFSACKLHSSVTPLNSQTNLNNACNEVLLFNCNSSDTHYSMAHYTALGSTVISAGTYCNDNIADIDLSWYVSSSAYATFYNPYVSPWIDVYNDDVSTSITPYLEGLWASDSDSACDTVAQDDEIWSEWSVQDTANVPLAVISRDRMTPLGTAADQTSTKATTDWTIAAANDTYKSTFKLAAPAAVTPNEVGHVRARVCVGIASKGFFIDPQIRGLA